MATRRLPGTRADRGARFLEPKSESIRELVMVLSNHHIVQPWIDRFYQFNPDNGQFVPSSNWCPYYIAPKGNSAVAFFLAAGLDIWFSSRVEKIQQGRSSRSVANYPGIYISFFGAEIVRESRSFLLR